MTRMAPLLRWRKRGNVSAPSPPTFYYRRGTFLTVRRGYKRAVVATAHKLARCAFAVLRDGTPYRDPATDYEALLVKRNAPRWLRTLRKFDILVNNDDGTVSVRWPERTVPMR